MAPPPDSYDSKANKERMNPLEALTVSEQRVHDACGDPAFPELGLIEQVWETNPIPVPQLDERAGAAVHELDLSAVPDGGEIAIGVGSRGIAKLPLIVSGVVETLREAGYEPFVVPAMGSHGGATAEGQRRMLESLGVTEEAIGCEVRASMEVEEIARTDDREVPAVADAHAAQADGIVLINRIKPHTDYDGAIESGLAKMLVIGLGKQRGAKIAHDWAIDWSLRNMIPEIARLLTDELPFLGGVAILEDQHDATTHVEGVPAEDLLERERELLERAEELLPRLPFADLDVLVVDRQGKDISGQGIDTNVIGRRPFAINEPAPTRPEIKRIYVRSLTEATHGNAMGVGSADFIHRAVLETFDATETFVNAITASTVRGIRLPPVLETDRAAMTACLSSIGVRSTEAVRLLRITDTMRVDRVYASPVLLEEAADRDDLRVVERARDITFDTDGAFTRPTPSGDDLDTPT